jgi:NAD(P)-dependent dehydrogenase (short-subunit alcohol dehydrogenase family)
VKEVDVDTVMRPGLSTMSSFQKGNYQMHSYQVAKLAVTTWIYCLARRWEGRGVTANLLDPRIVKGEFGAESEAPAPIRLMFRMTNSFVAAGTERSSEQYVRLATDPTLANVSGMYFVSGKEKKDGSSALSLDRVVQKRINDAAEAWAAPFLSGRSLAAPSPVQIGGIEDINVGGSLTSAKAERL